MKTIELIDELLSGETITNGVVNCCLKNNNIIYGDGSTTTLEDFLKFSSDRWKIWESSYFNDLKLGDKFYFKNDNQQKIYTKAMIYDGNITPISVGLGKNQSYSYVSNNPEVVKL